MIISVYDPFNQLLNSDGMQQYNIDLLLWD